MSNDQNDLSSEFIVSAKLDDNQKRELNIRLIKDKEKRLELETMQKYKDNQIDRERERLEDNRKKVVEEEMRQRIQPKPGQVLNPPGMESETPAQKADRLKQSFEMQQKDKDEARVKELENKLNEEIDREIKQTQVQTQSLNRGGPSRGRGAI